MKLFTISIGNRIKCKAANINVATAVLDDLLRIDMEPDSEVDIHIWREQ
jgi:hypothetical protein